MPRAPSSGSPLCRSFLLSGIVVWSCGHVSAGDRVTLENVQAPPEISTDEPLAPKLSLEKAARYLDTAALHWQKTKKCGTCHTNFAYLVARPSLASVSAPSAEVRAFFEGMVEKRWIEKGPRWPAEVVVAATTLAFNDAQLGGKLHPVTRKAFDRMWTLQRPDGGWDWLKCGWPPMESDDHYGVTFAALGVGVAPGGYARTEKARRGLEGIRRYLKKNPPRSLHHKAMVAWASLYVHGLMSKEEREKLLGELFDVQLADGGWAVAALIAGSGHKRQDDVPQETSKSDGYATGFVTYLARRAGVPASDKRLKRAVVWLKKNQRRSGRWFTPSPTKDSKHFITNVGTAFAVMALEACGEVRSSALETE